MTTNYLETIKGMVAIGMGWSLLPLPMVDQNLVALDSGKQLLQRELGYIHHQEKTLSNAARVFIDMLEDERGEVKSQM